MTVLKALQRNRTSGIYIDTYKRKLIIRIGSYSYGSQESRNLYNLWSTSCRTRKADVAIQSKSVGLRSKGSQWCNSQPRGEVQGKPQSLKAQEPRAPMSKGRRRWMTQLTMQENSPFLHLFVLFRPSADCHHQCAWALTNLLYSVY